MNRRAAVCDRSIVRSRGMVTRSMQALVNACLLAIWCSARSHSCILAGLACVLLPVSFICQEKWSSQSCQCPVLCWAGHVRLAFRVAYVQVRGVAGWRWSCGGPCPLLRVCHLARNLCSECRMGRQGSPWGTAPNGVIFDITTNLLQCAGLRWNVVAGEMGVLAWTPLLSR